MPLYHDFVCDGQCGQKKVVPASERLLAPDGWRHFRVMHSGNLISDDFYACSSKCAADVLARVAKHIIFGEL